MAALLILLVGVVAGVVLTVGARRVAVWRAPAPAAPAEPPPRFWRLGCVDTGHDHTGRDEEGW